MARLHEDSSGMWVLRRLPPRKGFPVAGCLSVIGVVCLGILLVILLDWIVPSAAVRRLPEGATEVQQFYRDAGFTGDFVRLVKARIPEEKVAEYARRMGPLHPVRGDEVSGHTSWSNGAPWFKPKRTPLYQYQEGSYRVLVGWEDGFVYFDAMSW